MNCLTELETAKWLKENCVTPNTYNNSDRPPYYIQFRAPTVYSSVEALTNSVYESNLDAGDFLIHITDWSTYTREQMFEFDSFRSFVEMRPLIEAAGHLFSADERELAVKLFGMATRFGWSSYLYYPDDIATLYNWEGELYDFWSRDPSRRVAMKKTIGYLELDVTHAG